MFRRDPAVEPFRNTRNSKGFETPGGGFKTTRISTVFEGGPCGIQRGSHGPLRTGEGLAQGHTAKLFIFTRFLKGFGELVRF